MERLAGLNTGIAAVNISDDGYQVLSPDRLQAAFAAADRVSDPALS